jgi:RimJ/RimL family protein N-acetyltransferase
VTVFQTNRLILRELTLEDDAFVYELLNEPAYLQFIGDKGVRSREDAGKYISLGPLASYAKNGFGLWLVALKDGNIPVGMCGLLKREGMDHTDLGYAVLARFHGRGYAYESSLAVLARAQSVLKLRTLQAVTAPENLISMGLLEKLGFRFDRLITLPGQTKSSRLFLLNL